MTDYINSILPRLEKTRKTIHQHPEVGLKEFETAKRIKNYLTEHSNAITETVTETGIIAVHDSGKPGETILLRADIDGVSHKCGHDGHTSIMLGVSDMLTKYPIQTGKVILLFQPAEENGMGAEAILKSTYFKDLHIDFVFALHNLPGFTKNQIVLKENTFNANVKSMIIKLKGKTAHAAEPEKGDNPALAIAEILQFSDKITLNNPSDDNFFLITPIHINMGDLAYGISAGEGELHLTIRSWDLNLFNEKVNDLQDFINYSCKKHKLTNSISWTQEFYANQNNNEALGYIRSAAKENNFNILEMTHSFKWGEDFGLFTQKYKGAMFGLGAGENTPALHNPDYDYPDDITETAIKQFYQIIKEVNKA
jgi:amidohydrolase